MLDIASWSFLRGQIVIVLRNRGLEHRRTKIRRVTEVFCPSVIAQKRETARIAPAHVDIPCVVPTLRGILQQVNRARWEADGAIGATNHWRGVSNIGRQHGIRYKVDARERTARPNSPRSRQRIVDQVGALQMHSV